MHRARLKPDLIIFDCDGVLVDSELLSCRCLSEVLAEFGIALSEDQALELFSDAARRRSSSIIVISDRSCRTTSCCD